MQSVAFPPTCKKDCRCHAVFLKSVRLPTEVSQEARDALGICGLKVVSCIQLGLRPLGRVQEV